jgi:Phosphoinositide phospholipase C, Ca2+-dependent
MRVKRRALVVVATVAALGLGACGRAAPVTRSEPATRHRLDGVLRFNEVQVLASHNSYKLDLYPEVAAALRPALPAVVAGLEYSHRSLAEQFDLGVRAIELDVYADPQGGKFLRPALPIALGSDVPDDPVMHEPGFKVLHQADVDVRANCVSLKICLMQVRQWSEAHPGHVPMMIQIEVKDTADAAELDALDAEIRSVIPEDEMVTPDEVRGKFPTLGEAVRMRGWPTLATMRGKLVFTLDNEGLRSLYRAGRPSLERRVMFTPSFPGADDAAFAKLNDPIADAARIKAALQAHMMVRTRADADTVQARTNDTSRRDAALASGAQWVSTDYEVPNLVFSPYTVRIPEGTPGRCNPVRTHPSCRSTDVEDPRRLGGS